MRLLPTQVNEILDRVEASRFERAATVIDNTSEKHPIIRLRGVGDAQFTIQEAKKGYYVTMCPGLDRWHATENSEGWSSVLTALSRWLDNIRRESLAIERRGASGETMPEWVLRELPSEHGDLVRQIEELQERERRLRRMGGLLWETGDPSADSSGTPPVQRASRRN